MRTALFAFGIAIMANSVYAQKAASSKDADEKRKPASQSILQRSGNSAQPDKAFDAFQRRLDEEGKRLQKQLATFDQRLAAAIKAQDDDALKRIEQEQEQLIADYERRIERVIAVASKLPAAPQSSAKKTQQRKKRTPSNNRPRSRGFRLWPFAR